MARKDKKGNWICGECVIEDINKMKLRVLGPDHKDVKVFIQKVTAYIAPRRNQTVILRQ